MLMFNEERHEYSVDGKVLPSVTQIISPLNDFSMIPPQVLERKRQIGSAVHYAVQLWLANDLDEESLQEECRGYFDGFKKWQWEKKKLVKLVSKVEVPQYHNRLRYAGTPDLEGLSFVIDIKCRPYSPVTDPLQLAGYINMGRPDRKGYVLELSEDGGYKFQTVATGQAWGMFRKMLDHHKSEVEIARLMEQWKDRKQV